MTHVSDEWQLQEANPGRDGAFKVLEHQGIPVIIRRAGTYCEATKGTHCTSTEPHVVITVGWGTTNGVVHYGDCDVSVFGARSSVRDHRKAMTVKKMQFAHTSQAAEPDQSILVGMSYLDEAVATLHALDAAFAAAEARLDFLDGVPATLERSEYERICLEHGVQTRSDEACDSYGVRYGVFAFPEYGAEHVAEMSMASRRLRGIEAEQAAAKAAQVPVAVAGAAVAPTQTRRSGQLWEPCERCGREPVYMPLHLCDRCWPTQLDPTS